MPNHTPLPISTQLPHERPPPVAAAVAPMATTRINAVMIASITVPLFLLLPLLHTTLHPVTPHRNIRIVTNATAASTTQNFPPQPPQTLSTSTLVATLDILMLILASSFLLISATLLRSPLPSQPNHPQPQPQRQRQHQQHHQSLPDATTTPPLQASSAAASAQQQQRRRRQQQHGNSWTSALASFAAAATATGGRHGVFMTPVSASFAVPLRPQGDVSALQHYLTLPYGSTSQHPPRSTTTSTTTTNNNNSNHQTARPRSTTPAHVSAIPSSSSSTSASASAPASTSTSASSSSSSSVYGSVGVGTSGWHGDLISLAIGGDVAGVRLGDSAFSAGETDGGSGVNGAPLSYEALLELGERLGSGKVGLTGEQIALLPWYRCQPPRPTNRPPRPPKPVSALRGAVDAPSSAGRAACDDGKVGGGGFMGEGGGSDGGEGGASDGGGGVEKGGGDAGGGGGGRVDCDCGDGDGDSGDNVLHCGWLGNSCAICREDFRQADVVRILPCADEFHAECIAPWLRQQATCPLCRCRFA